ncbi:MAG: 50S ribosomal protein L9 [bacterium]|nr:50S ribosomal protein L9 [bacterium]
MKVILNDHVEHLGERGDSVTVRPGYARNFLIPKGFAYPDSPGNRRQFEQDQANWEEMDLKRHSAAEKVAASLHGVSLNFERRAGEKDVLFGSVTSADIARELAEKGFEIDRRRVQLENPIKELGKFDVNVHIHRDVRVVLPLTVVRPGEKYVEETEEEPTAQSSDVVVDTEEPAEEA